MTGVLVMAYGGPDSLDDVEPYILDVRNHRPTSAELIAELRGRYSLIGGRSPILERTHAQAAALSAALTELGANLPVFVGMRHWHPYIADTLAEMEKAGVRRAIGLVMAPHFSRLSIGAYVRNVEKAGSAIEVRTIPSWHLLPEYLDAVATRTMAVLSRFEEGGRAGVTVLFTAHSLPERIVAEGDPYPDQLAATVAALRQRLAGFASRFAYQSAAMTPDPWLGPDAGAVIEELASSGSRGVVIVPIGFTSDHVEILYDIDIEYRSLAQRLGIRLERIDMMNDDAGMMRGLAGRVLEEARAAGWL